MHEYMTAYIYTSMTPVYSGLMRSHRYVWDDTLMTQTHLTASKYVTIFPKYGSLLKREFSLSLCRSEAELIPASWIIKGALFAWFLYIKLIIIWIKALLFMLQSTNAKCHHLLTVKLFCWVQKIFWKTFIQQDALHWSKVTLKTFTLFQKIIYIY